jgi:predicted dehydrogenase
VPLGFGVIGCGLIARFHARAIAELRGARLVGCYSRRAEQAQKFAAEHGCRAHASLASLLADPQVQVVTICTPSGAHRDPAVAAARAGKHVIVEKPLEITLARCDAIIRACDEHGVRLATVFPSRFHDSARALRRAAEAGRVGRLTLASAYVKWWRTQQYYDSGAWRGTWELDGGGALMNQAIHSVDLLAWLAGDVAEVRALTGCLAHARIAVEDTAVAALRFKNGALGTIEATTAAWPGYLKRVELHGDSGSAALEEESIVRWDFARPKRGDDQIRTRLASTKTGGGASDPAAIGHAAHARQFQDFVVAIHKDRAPAIDGREGRRAVEIILAIYKSAETGRAVKLPLERDPSLKARRGTPNSTT